MSTCMHQTPAVEDRAGQWREGLGARLPVLSGSGSELKESNKSKSKVGLLGHYEDIFVKV